MTADLPRDLFLLVVGHSDEPEAVNDMAKEPEEIKPSVASAESWRTTVFEDVRVALKMFPNPKVTDLDECMESERNHTNLEM